MAEVRDRITLCVGFATEAGAIAHGKMLAGPVNIVTVRRIFQPNVPDAPPFCYFAVPVEAPCPLCITGQHDKAQRPAD